MAIVCMSYVLSLLGQVDVKAGGAQPAADLLRHWCPERWKARKPSVSRNMTTSTARTTAPRRRWRNFWIRASARVDRVHDGA